MTLSLPHLLTLLMRRAIRLYLFSWVCRHWKDSIHKKFCDKYLNCNHSVVIWAVGQIKSDYHDTDNYDTILKLTNFENSSVLMWWCCCTHECEWNLKWIEIDNCRLELHQKIRTVHGWRTSQRHQRTNSQPLVCFLRNTCQYFCLTSPVCFLCSCKNHVCANIIRHNMLLIGNNFVNSYLIDQGIICVLYFQKKDKWRSSVSCWLPSQINQCIWY